MTDAMPGAGVAMRTIMLAALLLCVVSAGARAQTTPEGLWRTFDDRTGRERGLVRIQRQGDELIGRIVGTTDPAEAARTCDLCQGDRKGKPIEGLTIISGMRQDGTAWGGGQILDPQTGSVYRCTMRLADGGRTLIVRGFVGLSLLGRSQTWLRAQ